MKHATIALTGDFTDAMLMTSLLAEQGFHPEPFQPGSQVTVYGGERGYAIIVPRDESDAAIAKLDEHGFTKWLNR